MSMSCILYCLIEVLKYHIVPGAYAVSDLTDGMQLYTLHGTKITITIDDDGDDDDGKRTLGSHKTIPNNCNNYSFYEAYKRYAGPGRKIIAISSFQV